MRKAIVYPWKYVRLTYQELDQPVTKCANALRDLSIDPGDQVSLFLYNSAEFVMSFFGLLRARAVFNPINYRLTSGGSRTASTTPSRTSSYSRRRPTRPSRPGASSPKRSIDDEGPTCYGRGILLG